MTYQVMVRARPVTDMFDKHEKFMSLLAGLRNEWGLVGNEWPPVKDPQTLPMRIVRLSKYFRKGIMRAEVSYQNRTCYEDEGQFDDYFTFDFKPESRAYELLANEVFEKYVGWFNAYSGTIKDNEIVQSDFDAWRLSGINGRNGVFRICPVCFFDSQLCMRRLPADPRRGCRTGLR